MEESNLTVQVSAIRKALGGRKENPHYIITVPGHGYRFTGNLKSINEEEEEVVFERHALSRLTIETGSDTENQMDAGENLPINNLAEQGLAQLTHTDHGAAATRFRAMRQRPLLIGLLGALVVSLAVFLVLKRIASRDKSAGTTQIKSIAVLPFKPLVASERDESLEIGMADTLITRLSRIGQLTVRPTSAVRQYTKLEDEAAQAGRELRVDAVLDGSIQKSGDRVRVSVRVIRVDQGQTLWTEQFDEKFLNIIDLQDAIARKVAGALAVKLGGEERTRLGKHDTNSAEAYELYLKGRYFWEKFTPADHQKATEYFNQAIAKDPGYAVAYVGLADTYGASATNGWLPPHEAYPKAILTARKALSLDDTLAEAHANVGGGFMFYDFDWVSAEREYRRAIELNPDYEISYQLYSYLLCALGRLDEGVEKAHQALRVNPLSGSMGNDLGLAFYLRAATTRQLAISADAGNGAGSCRIPLGLGIVYEQRDVRRSDQRISKCDQVDGEDLG